MESEEEEDVELPGKLLYTKIEEKIKHLYRSNIEQGTKEILEILEEGNIIYPTQGPSIMKTLIGKLDDLYLEPSYAKLVQALHSSYKTSSLAWEEGLVFMTLLTIRFGTCNVSDIVEPILIDSDSTKVIAKLQIFTPLDPLLCTRLLWFYIHNCNINKEFNPHFVSLLIFLIREGADPFYLLQIPPTSFDLFLEKFSSHLSESLMTSVLTFLEEAFQKWGVSDAKESVLNNVIKNLPTNVIKGDSSHLSSIRGLIVKNCLEMIGTDSALCDHVDGDQKTPLHSLMEKMLLNGLWKKIPDLSESDSLWNLMSGLITSVNVNIKDNNKVTPYTWILSWQKSVADFQVPDEQKRQKFAKKIDDVIKLFQKKGASQEDALQGLKHLRYTKMEDKIQRLTRSNIEQEAKEVLEILDEGNIAYPQKGPSIIQRLVGKLDDLYLEPWYAKLVQTMYCSYNESAQAEKEDLAYMVWKQIRHGTQNVSEIKGTILITTDSIATEVFAKLKIFAPLDDKLNTVTLWNYIYYCYISMEWNSNFIGLLTFLIKEGADPFYNLPIPPTAFTLFLGKFSSHLINSLMPSVSFFLEEAFKKWEVSKTKESILNDVIKNIPNDIIIDKSSHLSSIKGVIVRRCLEIIETDSALSNHVDEEGKTPLHRLMEKMLFDGLWKKIPDLSGTDSIWDLMSRLITSRNVNIQDKDSVTPYAWILWWQKAVTDCQALDAPKRQKLAKKIDDIKDYFLNKGASLKVALQELPTLRYGLIEVKVQHLTRSNIEQEAKDILEILDTGEMTYPRHGPSIMKRLVGKTDELYLETDFAELVKILYPSYEESALAEEEGLDHMVWHQIRYGRLSRSGKGAIWITTDSIAKEVMAKLRIYASLDDELSSRLLSLFIKNCNKEEENEHFLTVLTFLMATVSSFLDTHGKSVGDTLNKIILAIPSDILQMQASPIRNFIVEVCLKLIKTNPAFLDSRDYKGRIPVANLMKKILFEQLWQKVSETDILWNLIYELVTDKNVNIKDDDQVTPYTWILLWHESVKSVSKLDALEKQKLIEKIEEMKKHCQEKGASERDASQGLSTLRERQMKALLERLINFKNDIKEQLKRSGRSIKEIVAEMEADVERVKDLKNKSCGECIKELIRREEFESFVKQHMEIRNDRINRITKATFEVIINKGNAQEIYDILMKKNSYLETDNKRIDYGYSFNPVLQLCLDKGSRPTLCLFDIYWHTCTGPTIKKICELSIETMLRCKTSEALSGAVQMMKLLIGANRKKDDSDPIEMYLNPIQDQYEVKEDLRIAAREVVRAAYGNLANCMQSESVINNLLFLRKDDGEADIRKSFENAENLMFLQGDTGDPPFTKWMAKEDDDDDEDDEDDDDSDDDVEKIQHKKFKKNLIKRNDNWLKRSILHLAAIFCHDGVLNYIPEDMIQKHINAKDIHGCTPLHIAHLHENKSAILFLESHGAKNVKDDFGRNPESPKCSYADCERIYRDCCFGIVEAEYSVFETMKKMNMLVLPVDECEVIGNQLNELFTRMVVDDGFLNAELVMAGSVREKLKVGRCDEFDLQICIKIDPYNGMPFACLRLHKYLVKRLIEADMTGIYLRCISVGNPWIFIWEGEGIYHGLEISVDVVPIFIKRDAPKENDKQGLIIENAPGHQKLMHLKWRDLEGEAHWNKTLCRHEWDILDNLPTGCRLGILISKALLQVLFHAGNRDCILSQEITSYLIKNVLFYLLVGQMSDHFARPHEEERYGALCQRLSFKTNPPKWTTAKDLERYAEEGRFWAEKIFDFILFSQRKYGKMIRCFLDKELPGKYFDDAVDVLVTCERCLQLLKPEIFYSEDFSEEACALSGGDSRLRTRLQEVIIRVNEEAEKVPGGLLWKKKKEVKRLKERMIFYHDLEYLFYIIRDEEICYRIEKEIDHLQHASEMDLLLLRKQEGEFDALDSAINQILQILGQANQKDSELFRLRGECEELEKSERNGEADLALSKKRWEELTRKRQECKDLEEERDELRSSAKSLLEDLEKKVCHLSTEECIGGNRNEEPKDDAPGAKRRSDDTEEETAAKKQKSESAYHSNELKDSELEDSVKCGRKRDSAHLEKSERECEEDQVKKAKLEGIPDESGHASSNIPETEEPEPLHLPGYDPNDVLHGGELDITTMDKYALLCGLPTPSALHLRVTSSTPVTPEVDPSESFTAIHYVANHYVVSHQQNGRIMLYDSLYHGQRIQQVLPQLASLYLIGSDASNIEYLVPQSQGATSDCGLFAAANATMLIHGIDPCTVALESSLLRMHMHQCLQDHQIALFPTLK